MTDTDANTGLELSAPQARVLGCLIEKAAATPDAYPLTLNALTTACNQTTNRHPVVQYEPTLVDATVHALKGKGLLRIVHPSRGERSTKYRHVADEALGLDRAQLAALCVLLLRGPQTVNELRTRTERLHGFASNAEVDATMASLATAEPPLVALLERRPGQKEPRWIQLLEAGVEERSAAPIPVSGSSTAAPARSDRIEELAGRVATLEAQVAELRTALGMDDTPED